MGPVVTAGNAQRVLKQVAADIAEIEAGEVKLSWSTVEGIRVVEASTVTVRTDAMATGELPGGIIAVAEKPANDPQSSGVSWAQVGQAFVDAYRAVFPKRERS